MKWPQFELWRLFAATGLFGGSMGCFLARPADYDHEFLCWLGGAALLAASIGTPFRNGIFAVLFAPVFLVLFVVLVVVIYVFVGSVIRALG